jgi:flavin-binding protein dodecin
VEVKSVLRIGSAHNNVDNGQAEAIERHQKTLRTVINEVDQLRIEIEAYKITEQEKDEDLDAWNANIVTQIAKGESKCGNLERVAQ